MNRRQLRDAIIFQTNTLYKWMKGDRRHRNYLNRYDDRTLMLDTAEIQARAAGVQALVAVYHELGSTLDEPGLDSGATGAVE